VSEIVESFQRICRDEPSRSLIFLPGRSRAITAADLSSHLQQRVQRLARAGLGAGDLVVSGTGNRPDQIALLLACRSLDVALMAVDPGATRAEIVQLGVHFGAGALVLPPKSAVPLSGSDQFDVLTCDGERRTYPHTAMLKLTSGSTGVPQAALTTDAQLIADGRQIVTTMDIGPTDAQLAVVPLSHAYGLGVLVMPLLLQGTPVILRESFVPQKLAADALEFGARRFPGVPFMFEYLLKHPPAEKWPMGLDRLVSAGAPLPPAVSRAFHRRFGVKVHTYYGTTETGGITYDASDDPEMVETVGCALDGVTLSLRPEIDLPGGRVHVRSRAVSVGYVDSQRDDFVDAGFLTGDYGTLADDGRLTLLGRVSSFINVAGKKVQPGEVEATLRALPSVADVRVIGGHDERRGEHVVACIVLQPDHEPLTALALRRLCAERLAPHKIPREVVFVDAIPLTARGKTDREALSALIRRRLKRQH
jgi:acyl-CoA synthetase (AMP-forming)/AMP-acid ligase II